MSNPTIISLAILKVNWDTYRKSYLDNFVPIVAECIRLSSEENISLPNIRSDIEKQFGLKIPQHTLKMILKKVQKEGFIKTVNKVYIRNNELLDKLKFNEMRREVMRMHESIISSLIKFSADNFNITLSQEDAEQALQKYIEENQMSIVAYSKEYEPYIPTVIPSKKIQGTL